MLVFQALERNWLTEGQILWTQPAEGPSPKEGCVPRIYTSHCVVLMSGDWRSQSSLVTP